MKYSTAAAAAALVAAMFARADAAPLQSPLSGTPGVLSADGTFHPTAPRKITQGTVPVTVQGTFFLQHSFTIISKLAAGTPLTCSLSLSAAGFSIVADAVEVDQVPATVDGNKGTCLLRIPFKWFESDPGNESVLATLTITTPTNAITDVPVGNDGKVNLLVDTVEFTAPTVNGAVNLGSLFTPARF